MISIVTWLWGGVRQFRPEYVNVLRKQCARHLPEPHRFICIADTAEGLDSEVEHLQTPAAAQELAYLQSPEGERFPSCFRRLWMFSDEARCLGERVLLLDIDLVVVGGLEPLFDMEQPFVGWRPVLAWGPNPRVGGGMYLLTPGSRTEVWADFKREASIRELRRLKYKGSDQAWLSYKLGTGEAYWPANAGLYSIRDLGTTQELPVNARIVQFNGPRKPWHTSRNMPAWVRANWR